MILTLMTPFGHVCQLPPVLWRHLEITTCFSQLREKPSRKQTIIKHVGK